MGTTPWKPVSMLDVHHKDPKYKYYWGRADEVDRLVAEGWEVVQSGKETRNKLTLIDGTEIGKVIRVRELVLFRMPREKVEQRKRYFEKMANDALKAEMKTYEQTASRYGEVKVNRGSQRETL